jgi:transposase
MLFYKDEHGASVGAVMLSLIETCQLNVASAWEYLLVLTRNRSKTRANPAAYLPWSYAREEPEEECGQTHYKFRNH